MSRTGHVTDKKSSTAWIKGRAYSHSQLDGVNIVAGRNMGQSQLQDSSFSLRYRIISRSSGAWYLASRSMTGQFAFIIGRRVLCLPESVFVAICLHPPFSTRYKVQYVLYILYNNNLQPTRIMTSNYSTFDRISILF